MPPLNVPVRTDALRLVSVDPNMSADRSWLLAALGGSEPYAVQSAALTVLGRLDDPIVLSALIQGWPVLTPALRREAVAALLFRNNRVAGVMAALQDRRIDPADVPPFQKNLLRTFQDPAISGSALRLFGPVPIHRLEAVQQFAPALDLKGASDRGREIFTSRCAACHESVGSAESLGLSLVQAKIGGKRKILTAILEPNAELQPEGAASVVETGAGEVLIGLLLNENPTTITLGQPIGVRIVLSRGNVRSSLAQPWSFMPAGLEEGLSAQDMADLLEYVMTVPR